MVLGFKPFEHFNTCCEKSQELRNYNIKLVSAKLQNTLNISMLIKLYFYHINCLVEFESIIDQYIKSHLIIIEFILTTIVY